MNAEDTARLAEELAEEKDTIAQAEERYWLRRERARERKLWKARSRMPMHGKHLLRPRDNRRRHRRRSEHIMEE